MLRMRALVFVFILSVFTVVRGKKDENGPKEDGGSIPHNVGDKTAQVSKEKSPSNRNVELGTQNKKSKEDYSSSGETDENGSTTWDGSLNELVSHMKQQINDHIESITNSAQQATNGLAGQAMGLVETTKDKANNRMLVGRVYKALVRSSANQRLSPDQMVDAFATAITVELNSWMPTHVNLPGLEMKVNMKYMCGTGGQISNLQKMVFKSSRYGDIAIEDPTITAVLTYSFTGLHMTYDHYGESTFLTFPVIGNLDLGFYDSEVEFELDIPNVSVLSATNFNPECLISVRNFIVTRLATPQARIEPASAYRTFAEQMVDKFSKWHEAEFRNLFRMGVVESLHDLLQSDSKWICKTENLQKVFEIDDKNVMKPQRPEKFEKYCGETAIKKANERLGKQTVPQNIGNDEKEINYNEGQEGDK